MLVGHLRNTTVGMKPFVIMDIVERRACQQWSSDMVCVYKRLLLLVGCWDYWELEWRGECETKKGTLKLLGKAVKTK